MYGLKHGKPVVREVLAGDLSVAVAKPANATLGGFDPDGGDRAPGPRRSPGASRDTQRDGDPMSMAESPPAISRRSANCMNAAEEVLRTLERSHFYGSLEIKFEAGRVVLLRKTETIKPDHRDTRGMKNEYNA